MGPNLRGTIGIIASVVLISALFLLVDALPNEETGTQPDVEQGIASVLLMSMSGLSYLTIAAEEE